MGLFWKTLCDAIRSSFGGVFGTSAIANQMPVVENQRSTVQPLSLWCGVPVVPNDTRYHKDRGWNGRRWKVYPSMRLSPRYLQTWIRPSSCYLKWSGTHLKILCDAIRSPIGDVFGTSAVANASGGELTIRKTKQRVTIKDAHCGQFDPPLTNDVISSQLWMHSVQHEHQCSRWKIRFTQSENSPSI